MKKYPNPIIGDSVKCPVCSREYKDRSGYRYHYNNEHRSATIIQKSDKLKETIKEEYGITEKELLKILSGRGVQKIEPLNISIKGSYKFAAIADTHLCSNDELLRELHTFYRYCKKEGIKDVYHAGDILEGQGVYPGQEYEIHTFGADNQVNYVINNYPSEPGITTHFIIGNHDYAYYKKIGLNVGDAISEKRKDMNYLGAFVGKVERDGKLLIQLVHPDGGMPYALTYRAQKYAEQIASGKKPKVLLMGHLHTKYNVDYRNMEIFGCGAFQGQTAFILRKGINPVIGGWIIELRFADDTKDSVVSIKHEFIKFFD